MVGGAVLGSSRPAPLGNGEEMSLCVTLLSCRNPHPSHSASYAPRKCSLLTLLISPAVLQPRGEHIASLVKLRLHLSWHHTCASSGVPRAGLCRWTVRVSALRRNGRPDHLQAGSLPKPVRSQGHGLCCTGHRITARTSLCSPLRETGCSLFPGCSHPFSRSNILLPLPLLLPLPVRCVFELCLRYKTVAVGYNRCDSVEPVQVPSMETTFS